LNSLTKTLGFAYRNLIFAKRNIFAFTEILFWPMVSLISIGLMGSFLQIKENFLNFVMTGAVTAGVLQVTQLDVSYSMLYDIWSKSTKHTFLAPCSHVHYIIGSWLIGVIRGSVVFVLLYAFSSYFFHFSLPPIGRVAVFAAGVFLNALIIGMMVCFLILLFGQRVDIAAWMFATLLMLICGIYYPVNYLPEVFVFIAQLVPLTFFLEYLRSFYGFEPLFSHSLLKGFLESFVYIALFFVLLNKAYEKSRKTGMILRLSE
jgi:ABC-2 type transport system permease protein